MYVVYGLTDPRTRAVRYVGVTDNVYARFLAHINCNSNNLEKNLWIVELRSQGYMVIMETLEIVSTKEIALEQEKYWIAHYLRLGALLFNINGCKDHFKRVNGQSNVTVKLAPLLTEEKAEAAASGDMHRVYDACQQLLSSGGRISSRGVQGITGFGKDKANGLLNRLADLGYIPARKGCQTA